MSIWQQKIKSVKNMEDGRQLVVEDTVINIISEPNRHRVESIIYALCLGVKALADAQIASEERILKLQREMGMVEPVKDETLPLFEHAEENGTKDN